MRLTEIRVSKLFGMFDHTVPLNQSDRITIIYGPNGYGKTAILLLVQGLLGGQFSKLRRFPFDEFSVSFEDGRKVYVTQTQPAESDKEVPQRTICIRVKYPDGKTEEYSSESSQRRDGVGFPLEIVEHSIAGLQRIGPETWIHVQTGQHLQLDDVLDNYIEFLPIRHRPRKKLPEWLAQIPREFDVRLIEAQRLIGISDSRRPRVAHAETRFKPAVMSYAQELAASIQAIQAQYGTFSQQLDSTFPNRVIQRSPATSLGAAELVTKLKELEAKRQRIIAAGLLTKEQQAAPIFDPQTTVDETTKNILSLYAEDVEKKLSVFDQITARIDLFKELVNKRFSYKQLDVESEDGIRLQTHAGLTLLPIDLSSGEQHELVLLYELLFRTKENTLILIDEPELSLHVEWQVEILKDLARVIKLSTFDVLLATHSPQIINNRWDLTVELKGPRA